MTRISALLSLCVVGFISVIQATRVLIGDSLMSIDQKTGDVTFFIIHADFEDEPSRYECLKNINDGRKAIDLECRFVEKPRENENVRLYATVKQFPVVTVENPEAAEISGVIPMAFRYYNARTNEYQEFDYEVPLAKFEYTPQQKILGIGWGSAFFTMDAEEEVNVPSKEAVGMY